jgi:hypothetical protein
MRINITIFVLSAIACVFASDVQCDEPIKTNDRPTFSTSPIGQELLDTLELAFTQRLEEYKAGRSGPEHSIRLNRNLYEEQISAAAPNSRRLVAENYVERAMLIEEIAKRSLDNGTGLSQQLLEAKAARLSAAIACDCGKNSQRIVRVTAQYPAARPQEVANALASPIEIKLRELPHVDSITSISSAERLEAYVVISHDGHPEKVLRRITAEMQSSENQLPFGATAPAVELLPRTATVPAESLTDINGVVVEPKREALAKYGITVRNVVSALQEQAAANVSAVGPMEELRAVRVTGPHGNEVPVTELAELRVEKQPSHIVTRWPSE